MSLARSVRMAALPGLFFLSSLTPLMAQQRALGLDVSAWQANISQTAWNGLRSSDNRQFVVIRSSRGGTTGFYNQNDPSTATLSQRYDDPYFIQNVNRATAAGMFVGSYHFTRPDVAGNTGTDEADHFIQMAGPWMRPGYLPPVHDFEAGSGTRSSEEMAQYCIDFSNRIYEKMGIRPAIYTSGNYAGILQAASAASRDQLAKPPAKSPSVVSPCYPYLWSARWPNQSDPNSIDVQNEEPKNSYTPIYGPWDDYGVTHPWVFWQYASTAHLPSYSTTANLDVDAARGGIEFIKDNLIPAVWMSDSSGAWTTLTNWNSGKTPVQPVPGSGQVTPVATGPLPTPRLPSTNDTVILERPDADITVTLASGTQNIRKLYVRETLNITGGSLNLNYVPSADSTLIAAQFSAPVALSGSGSLKLHTLQVDTNQTLTLGGGTLAFNTVNLMPHSTTPAQIAMTGDVAFNSFSETAAVITNGSGSGTAGSMDLSGAARSFNVANGAELFVEVAVANGGVTKSGLGTMRLDKANTYAGGTIVSAGTLLVNNTSGSGTGNGAVTVNGGVLGGTGTISGNVTVNASGTITAGTPTSFGTLTLGTAPTLNGTTLLAIDRNGGASLADKIVLTSGTLNYSGALVISNAGATLTGGEIFTNFNAPSYGGEFTSLNLPALDDGLNWYLGNLQINGSIKVNRKPVANVVGYASTYPATLQIPIADLLAEVTDADGDAIQLEDLNLTTTNGVTLVTNGTDILYLNSSNVYDRFFYTVSDGHGGSVTGIVDIVSLEGIDAPFITAQPLGRTNTLGTTASFTVAATGTSPTYQWRKGSTNLADGGKISGATSASLTVSDVSLSDAASYSVVVSNVAGKVTSAAALLSVIDPPVVTTHPTGTNIWAGRNASFTGAASGTGPLSYQWRLQGNPVSGATNASLSLTNVSTNQAGNYDFVVSNVYGAATSHVATLTVNPPNGPSKLEVLWRLAPYSRPYLTTNDLPYERGMTYNPATHHVLLASRSNHVFVLDASTGAHLYELNMTGVTGGQYPLLLIQAADDGAIYAGNLNTSTVSPNFRIYRWANDNSNTVATLAFSADPIPGTGKRWGDSFDVRGAGTNTQILITPRSGSLAAILTTSDGLTFTSHAINLNDTPDGYAALGLAFGEGDTFWGTTHTNLLRQIAFNLNAGTSVTLREFTDAQVPTAICPVGYSTALRMIAGVHVFSANHLRVYDLTATNGIPNLVGSTNFPADNSNTHTGAGSVRFGGDTVYALDSNNGLMAARIVPLPTAPTIDQQPQSLTISNGQPAALSVSASGTAPLSYQWFFNGSLLPGETGASWSKAEAHLADAGNYTVVITNVGGAVTSSIATLTVQMPVQFDASFSLSGDHILLSGTGNPGPYVVEATSTPFTNWTPVTNITVDVNGNFNFVDPVTNADQRFYRLVKP